MTRSNFSSVSIVIVVCVALMFATSSQGIAKARFSGKVIDEAGKPVPDVTVELSPVAQEMHRLHRHAPPPRLGPALQSKTDEAGVFTITDIAPQPTMVLGLHPFDGESDYELRGIKIEGIAFYIDPRGFRFRGFPFAIAPDAEIKDVEITVRSRMRIRARVLSEDSTPLRHTRVDVTVKWQGSRNNRSFTLDEEGFFVWYPNRPGGYTINVSHQGQMAASKLIEVKEGQRVDGVVLKLSEEAAAQAEAAQQPKPKPRVVIEAPAIRAPMHMGEFARLQEEGVWAINPENRHAYKRIKCESLEDAQTIADEASAHLVAINDEAEQLWLLAVFGEENFWIGLKAGAAKWDNDEPVTYTNWNPSLKPTEEDTDGERYAVLVGKTRAWEVAREGSPVERITEYAILEKAVFILDELVPADDSETR